MNTAPFLPKFKAIDDWLVSWDDENWQIIPESFAKTLGGETNA